MRMAIRWLTRIIEGLSSITGVVAAICIMAAALIITEGVVARKIFNLSGMWQIELSVFLLIFACFVGAAFVQKEDHHLNVDLILVHLPPKIREITLIVVSIITCFMCALIAWYAWPMWWEAVVEKQYSESIWRPPLWIPYFFLPFGMSLFFLQYIVHIAKKINQFKKNVLDEDVTRAELKDIDIPKLKQSKTTKNIS